MKFCHDLKFKEVVIKPLLVGCCSGRNCRKRITSLIRHHNGTHVQIFSWLPELHRGKCSPNDFTFYGLVVERERNTNILNNYLWIKQYQRLLKYIILVLYVEYLKVLMGGEATSVYAFILKCWLTLVESSYSVQAGPSLGLTMAKPHTDIQVSAWKATASQHNYSQKAVVVSFDHIVQPCSPR